MIAIPIALSVLFIIIACLPVRQPDDWAFMAILKLLFCAFAALLSWMLYLAYLLGTRAG